MCIFFFFAVRICVFIRVVRFAASNTQTQAHTHGATHGGGWVSMLTDWQFLSLSPHERGPRRGMCGLIRLSDNHLHTSACTRFRVVRVVGSFVGTGAGGEGCEPF